MAQQLSLPDARSLQYLVSGAQDANAFPLVWHHGTPGAYPALQSLATACDKRHFKLITYSRAGYGDSTRRKGRRVIDEADDVRALLKHLGLQKFAVGGWSGGGCIAVVVVAGLAPYDGEGLDITAAKSESNVAEHAAAMKGEEALRAYCEPKRILMMEASIAEELASMLDVDKKAFLASPGMDTFVEQSFREGFKHSCDGWMDDDFAFYAPWGFDVSTDINVPVFIYQGSADSSVPIAHGQWLASHINQKYVTKHLQEGDGHVSIMLSYTNRMLDEVRAVVDDAHIA